MENLTEIAKNHVDDLSERERIELFKVEELEERFELSAWISLQANGVCGNA